VCEVYAALNLFVAYAASDVFSYNVYLSALKFIEYTKFTAVTEMK